MITLKELKNIGNGDINPEPTIDQVKQNGDALRCVHNQTPEICLAAVKQFGYALRCVHNQTPEICDAAVKQNGYALQYAHNQTPEICLEAVKQEGYALQYVDASIFKEDPKEMTLLEVSELLGYDVKIVK